jgi:glutamine amidotransferase
LCDDTYRSIHGNIDSEHIFALTIGQLKANPSVDLATALETGLKKLIQLSQTYDTFFSANMIISDGTQLVAFRYSNRNVSPTLYYLADPQYFSGTIVASELIFAGNWQSCPDI